MAKLPIRLKRNTDEPLKAQEVRQISEFIKSDKLKPGAALPSTHSLGEQLSISPETVRRAYVQLREAKLIEREEKRGYRVQGATRDGFRRSKRPRQTQARSQKRLGLARQKEHRRRSEPSLERLAGASESGILKVPRHSPRPLREQGYMSFVDVLIALGELTHEDHGRWRFRRIPCLEQVITINFGVFSESSG